VRQGHSPRAREALQHLQSRFICRILNVAEIAGLHRLGKNFQKTIRVSSQLGFTDEVSSQILISELLLQPFLENLRALIEKDFRDRGGHCSGVEFIFLPLPKRAAITNLHAGSREGERVGVLAYAFETFLISIYKHPMGVIEKVVK
jgi:hypothetical protein